MNFFKDRTCNCPTSPSCCCFLFNSLSQLGFCDQTYMNSLWHFNVIQIWLYLFCAFLWWFGVLKYTFSDISEKLLEECLFTACCRPVDLLIRTSGEVRLSDFLLWEVCIFMQHTIYSFLNMHASFVRYSFFFFMDILYLQIKYLLGFGWLMLN